MIIGNTAGFHGGMAWRQLTGAGSRNWRGLAISANGQYMAGVVIGGYVYISSDYGATWTQKLTSNNWRGVSMSDDGAVIIAISYNSYSSIKSTNYGATWTSLFPYGEDYGSAVAVAPSGNSAVAAYYDSASGYFSARMWKNLKGTPTASNSASLGSVPYLTAASNNYFVYGGNTIYTQHIDDAYGTLRSGAGARNWRGAAISSDGQIITAVVGTGGGYIYRSTDNGANWTEITADGSKVRRGCAMSADGQVIAVTEDAAGGQLSLSFDGGTTWAAQPDAGTAAANYYACAVTPDGSKVLAAPYGGGVFLLE